MLAAHPDDTVDKERPSDDDEEDGFIVTQDDNTEDNETLGGETPKGQRGSGRKTHQKTHVEARHPAYGGGGTLGLSSDGEDGETGAPDARPGSPPVNKGRKAWARLGNPFGILWNSAIIPISDLLDSGIFIGILIFRS